MFQSAQPVELLPFKSSVLAELRERDAEFRTDDKNLPAFPETYKNFLTKQQSCCFKPEPALFFFLQNCHSVFLTGLPLISPDLTLTLFVLCQFKICA